MYKDRNGHCKIPLGEHTYCVNCDSYVCAISSVVPEVKHPMQPVYLNPNGVAQYKENKIVLYLLDHGGIDMNRLAMLHFSDDDRTQFAQLIGYTVDGAAELSYFSEEITAKADLCVKKLK